MFSRYLPPLNLCSVGDVSDIEDSSSSRPLSLLPLSRLSSTALAIVFRPEDLVPRAGAAWASSVDLIALVDRRADLASRRDPSILAGLKDGLHEV